MAAEKTTEPDEVLTDEELQAAAAPEPDSANNNEAHKRTVVVAEDESVNRMDLVAMLEDNGYEVVGEAARCDIAGNRFGSSLPERFFRIRRIWVDMGSLSRLVRGFRMTRIIL